MKKFLLIILPVFLSIFVFKDLFATYFQQDEWHAFGIMLSEGKGYVTMNQSVLQLLFSGDRAGARFLMYCLFSNFGFNIVPYFSLSLGLHFLNSFLVYRLSYKLLKNKVVAYVALLFFLFSGLSSQVYTWLGTFAGSVTSMTFLLLSLYVYLIFLFDKGKLLFVYLSLILLWISFLFKETGFFFLIFYPVIYFLYKKDFIKTLKINFPFLAYGFLLVAFRINEILMPVGDAVNLVTSRIGIWKIIFNVILYPLQGLSQLILPSNIIYPLSQFFASVFSGVTPNTTEFDVLVQFKIAPAISVLIALAILIFLFKFIYNRFNNLSSKYVFVIKFCVIFIIFSFIPYFVIQKQDAYFEPRYYYNGLFASSILLGTIFALFIRSKKIYVRGLVVVFFFALAYSNLVSIKDEINLQKEAATERKYIINTIQKNVPYLPGKVIFYTSGDAIGYYGLEELKVPFQSGLGQTLLVTYSYNNQITPRFLHEDSIIKTQGEGFLYGILDQGYREVDGRGFGYFWDMQELKKSVRENNISPDNVYGFYYNSEKKSLEDISDDVRNKVRKI